MKHPNLSTLIAPHQEDEFLRRYWQKKYLYIPGDEKRFESLFTWDTLTYLLNYKLIDPAYIQCCINDEMVPPHELIRDLPQMLRGTDPSIVQSYLNQGATLIIARIHEKTPELTSLCSGLSYEVGDPVISNLYCSWPGVQGFDIHADTHGLFVVQLEGVKEWYLFKPFNPYREEDPSAFLDEVYTLKKGDVLYIPRGIQHCAMALEPSAHVTIGIYPKTVADLVNWVSAEVKEDPVMYNDMAMGIQNEPLNYGYKKNRFREHLETVKAAYERVLNDPDFVDRFNAFCIGHEVPSESFNFPHYGLDKIKIKKTDKFERKSYQKVSVRHDKQRVNVFVWGKKLSYDIKLKPIIDYIFTNEHFKGKTLLDLDESNSWEEVQTVLTGLMRWGIATLASKSKK